jgi:hypothetical protein
MKKQTKKQRDEEAYQAAIEAVHRLTEKQKARLLAELQDASFRLDLADMKFDADLSGMELNLELPELDFKLPDLEKPDVCPYCGKQNRE